MRSPVDQYAPASSCAVCGVRGHRYAAAPACRCAGALSCVIHHSCASRPAMNTSSADHQAAVSLTELRDRIRHFTGERDWDQFHTPKNLAMALSVEVAELVEHFQ